MGLVRRALSLAALGAAAAAVRRRRGVGGQGALTAARRPWSPDPGVPAPLAGEAAAEVEEAEAEAEPEAEPEPAPAGPGQSEDEAETATVPAIEELPSEEAPVEEAPVEEAPVVEELSVEDPEPPGTPRPASVTDIVDDLLSPPAAGGERIEEATVVDGSAEEIEGRPDGPEGHRPPPGA